MLISVISFAFKEGNPLTTADMIFDVRFFRNPYYEHDLKGLTGLDELVMEYIMKDKSYANFIKILKNFFDLTLPRYEEEGKSYLNIAFGCTGGKHRSVFFAETIGLMLHERGYKVSVYHRDLK